MPGHRETRHPSESALSTGIRIPPPCLPPGSSKQRLASSPPLLPQQRIHVSRAAWRLGPAERVCQALLSTSYQMGKRDGHAKPGWQLKSSSRTPASRKVPQSSSAPLPSSLLGKGLPREPLWQLPASSPPDPFNLHAATLRASLSTHRTARSEEAGGDSAGGRRMEAMGNFFFR